MRQKSSYVTVAEENGIGRVTFYHEKKNSMPSEQLGRLAKTFSDVAQNDKIRVVVLQSAGDGAFCAGASFDELVAISNREEGLKFFSGFAKVINAMRRCPKLIIGRIQGKTVGGGVGLASATDYCFAHESASVKLSELAIGIGPFVVGPAVERKAGLSGMSELAIDAQSWRSAQWARERGLFNQVFSTHEAMDEAINGLASRLAASSPEAMHRLKEALWHGTAHWEDLLMERAAISGELVLSDFTRKAIAAFKQQRK
jgi:methylglutaconyl-CoA hydratase